MDQASPQCMDDDSSLVAYQQDERLPKIVVHFSVMPGVTLTWRVEADSTLAVQGARIWLTRISSPYDHWLAPGDEFRLHRGERVWLSTDDDGRARVADEQTRCDGVAWTLAGEARGGGARCAHAA